TKIYVKAFNAIKDKIKIKGMAHITGGGISGNLPRIFPEGISAVIYEHAWTPPPIFHIIKEMGKVPLDNMRMTFNMGIGYIIAIPEAESKNAISILNAAGVDSFVIGNIEKGGHGVRYA
ncbi:MAG: AIR synthase-related protein, partial [Thermodesulfovibrionales bacterium]|nr:AIR synthase-related protein [Thermodesulfovibrionales bacterium]